MGFVEIWLYLGRLFNPKQNIRYDDTAKDFVTPIDVLPDLQCNGFIVVDFGPGGGFLSGRNNG